MLSLDVVTETRKLRFRTYHVRFGRRGVHSIIVFRIELVGKKEMAFSEFEARRYERLVAAFVERRRPPAHIRSQVDLGYRIKGQSVEIFEIRPFWRDPDEMIEEAVAKATYVKKQNIWKVYWQRADLKWHRYDPDPEVDSLEDFLALVERDEYACFFG